MKCKLFLKHNKIFWDSIKFWSINVLIIKIYMIKEILCYYPLLLFRGLKSNEVVDLSPEEMVQTAIKRFINFNQGKLFSF